MSSQNQNCSLVILDVGHGNAAVLSDEGGVAVFDTGRGAHIDRFLNEIGRRDIALMFLSHADVDHIGGAVTLLLNRSIAIHAVFLNPDASKDTDVFTQLRVALSDSQKRSGTRIDPSLTTSTVVSRHGAKIEILHPSPIAALGGVGGKREEGGRSTSNSLSAAIRISTSPSASVLLGGDIESDCVDAWKSNNIAPLANALVFPHHGGLPGNADDNEAALFAFELTRMVNPSIVVFSIHRTRHNNPRDSVLTAITRAVSGVKFACTQLPERIRAQMEGSDAWPLHRDQADGGVIDGAVEFVFADDGVEARFRAVPVRDVESTDKSADERAAVERRS